MILLPLIFFFSYEVWFFFTSWHTVCTEMFQNSYMNSSIITLVFFQLLRRFWWLNNRKFPKKSIEIGFKLIYWFFTCFIKHRVQNFLDLWSKTKKNLSLVFFKILTCFWCLNTSKFRHKTIGESFKLIWWFSRVFLNTAYKICRWKQKGGQKEDKGVKISKSNIWPIMLEMTDLHIKSSFRNPKIFTDMILLAVEFSLYTNFVRGVALNAYKSSNQLETFSNRFLAKFPYI